MNCEDCGAEVPKGGYYCSCCGRPVGFQPVEVSTAAAEPGLEDVPAPAASKEAPSGAGLSTDSPFRSRVQGKGLCSMCMGAFPETVLSIVDNKPYCPDCSPMVGRRREPEIQEGAPPPDPDLGASFGEGMPSPLVFHDEKRSGGAKGLIAVVVLVLLAGAGFAAFTLMGGDRIDALMSGLDTGRGDAYLLAQSYIPGESMYYEARGTAKANGDVSGGGLMGGRGGEIEFTAELFGGVTVDVKKVDEQGNAELAVTTENLDLDLDLRIGGTPWPLGPEVQKPLSELKGKTLVLSVDPFGNPLEGSEDAGGMQQMMSGQFGEMPRRHLKVGDTWNASMPFGGGAAKGMPPGLAMGDLSFAVRYRVEGFKRLADRDCMVISMKGSLAGADSIRMPFVDDVKMDMGLKGAIFYDVSIGRLVKVAMDMDLELGFASQMGGADFDLEFQLDIDLK